MKIARLAGLVFVAVMAVSLVIASTAFAEPAFLPVGATFTGTSGTSTLTAGASESVVCAADTSSGTISNATLVGGVTVDFTGCKSSGAGGSNCTVKSINTTTEGLILTNTLHGVLGLILPKGSGTGVGLLLLPVASKTFVTLAKNTCTVETAVKGNVAGEVKPIGVHQLTGKLIFAKATTGGQSIKDFDLSTGGLVQPELEAFGALATEETEESITFSTQVEVS
jgi:hypothetical protein